MTGASALRARNVVLVLVDAMRADRLGAYGGTAGTPAMDGLARRGVVFANACAQAPSTRPSVSSLMTGLYPSQHGIVDRVVNKARGAVTVAGLDSSVPMLAQVLADAGVTTAAFLGGNANVKPVFGLTRGFGHVDWRPTTDGSVLVDDFAAWATAGHEGETFSYLHFMDVHHPLPMEIIPGRLDDGLDVDAAGQTISELVGYYDEAVALVDRHIDEVLIALDAAGMAADSMVIVTADHGEEMLEHGAMLAHGRTLYRELVHVPLLMRLPGDAYAGTVEPAPVQLVDLFPTVLDVLGQPPVALPGRSLLASLGGSTASDRPAFSELHRRGHYSQSVTTATHQLVVTYVFSATGAGRPENLRPGVRVRVKGQKVRGGRFLATKIGLSADRLTKMRGTVEEVDPETGTVMMLGVRFVLAPDATWIDLHERTSLLHSLVPSTRLSVHLEKAAGAGWVAVSGAERKPGGKSKLEGLVERVDRDGEAIVLRVLGVDVEVPVGTTIGDRSGNTKHAADDKAHGLQRMLAAEFVDRRVELFDLARDPRQERNIVDDRPDIAQELEGRLAAWTEWMSSRVSSTDASVDVDPETLDQLRRMGYLE